MELVFLTQDDCRGCDDQKIFMDNEGIDYKEINLSEEPQFVNQYGVMSTPVTILEEDGEEITRVSGFIRDSIEELADNL